MSKSILVIDDEIGMQRLIGLILRRKGYQVAAAGDVPEALEKITANPPDLICCDLQMPLISGIAFLEMRQEDPGLAAIPVVMISSTVDTKSMRESEALGAQAFLSKPFSQSELLKLVEEALSDTVSV